MAPLSCLAWLVTCLSPRRVQPPWAVAEVDCVDAALETALGAYPVHLHEAWRPGWDLEDISDLAEDVPPHPNFWIDGSRDEDLDAMVGVAGAGAFVKTVPWVFDNRAWGHAQDLDLDDDAARIFSMVPWSMQIVQRAEYWVAILALQAVMPVHLGIDKKMFAITLVRCFPAGLEPPFVFVLMVTFLLVLVIWSCIGLLGRLRSARSRVMPLMSGLLRANEGRMRRVTMLLILQQILAGFDVGRPNHNREEITTSRAEEGKPTPSSDDACSKSRITRATT